MTTTTTAPVIRAQVFGSGLIEFSNAPLHPEALFLAFGNEAIVRKTITTLARRGHDGTLLAPGIPEAPTHDAALKAFNAFFEIVQKALKRQGVDNTGGR